jgi:hypothetical protein
MTGKGVPIAVVAALSILFFVVGAGGGFLAHSSRKPPETSEASARRTVPRPEVESAVLSESSIPQPPSPAPSSTAPAAAEAGRPDTLVAGLKSVGTLLREAKKLSEKNVGSADELYKRLNQEWRAIQAAALGDAATLFAFLRDPKNKAILEDFLALVVSYELGPNTYTGREPAELPAPVVDLVRY